MKKTICFITTGFLFLFLLTGICHAQDRPDIGLAAKGGTLGVGLESTIAINPNFNARFGFNWLSYDDDDTYSGINYDYDLDLLNVPLLVDWHPQGGGFRVTAGIIVNNNELEIVGKATSGTFTIDDTVYTAAQVGSLKGDVDFNAIAPYIGIGYGNAVGKDKKWSIALDLGVMFQGSPDVGLAASGPIATDPTFQSELARERASLEDDIDEFEYYPVIMIGVSYKF